MSTDVNKTLGLSPRLREILGGLGVTELGYLDGVTAGTTTASKALVVGSGKNVNILTMNSAIASVHAYTAGLTATGTTTLSGASAHVNTLYAGAIGCSGAVSGTFTGTLTSVSATVTNLYGNPKIGGTNYAAGTPTASASVAAGTVSGSGSVVITPGLSATQVVATLNAAPLYASGGASTVAVTAISGASATVSFYDMAGGAASANASAYWIAFGT